MSEARIDIKAGGAEFSAPGSEDWVSKQLDKFLQNAANIAAIPVGDGSSTRGGTKASTGIAAKPLATYLKEQNATTTQVKKFYATAAWLHAKGAARLSTGDVTKALKSANQTKINNPSDCLNKNVSKGLCEKDGDQFFVTDSESAS